MPYVDNIDNNQVGTYALRHYALDRGTALAGYFIQTHAENSKTGFYQDEIAFVSIDLGKTLSLIKMLSFKWRFAFGSQLFRTREEFARFTRNVAVGDATKISQDILQEWRDY